MTKPKKVVPSDSLDATAESTRIQKVLGVLKKLWKILSSVPTIIVTVAIVCGSVWIIIEAYQAFDNYVHPPPDKKVWQEEDVFGYTPNTSVGTTHTFVVPENGSYRVVCTQGYIQHNLPAFADDYTVFMPCSGGWIPKAVRKNHEHNLASQVVIMNGSDLSNGRTSINLKSGQNVQISAMTNIGSVHDGKRTVSSLFRDNTGTVKFSIQRLVAK